MSGDTLVIFLLGALAGAVCVAFLWALLGAHVDEDAEPRA